MHTPDASTSTLPMPDAEGRFGEYGGSFVPEALRSALADITLAYERVRRDESFQKELASLYSHFVGRPTPVFHAQNLTRHVGGAQIFLKREDLAHTGAHKINHCLGEALLAKWMGKKRLIAETGAGQHGVALATAAALVGLECHVYMGEVDIAKEAPNVTRMRVLGARVVPVKSGQRTLKEAVDEAFVAYLADPVTQLYAIGSVVGPHPFPMMVRDFQSIVGREARGQFREMTGHAPHHVVACVGGGSNAMGIFSAFLDEPNVRLYGVEPGGRGTGVGEHAATLSFGRPGIIHGFRCHLLQDEAGNPAPVYSIASGLDYPGVGPQHSHLKDVGRVSYVRIDDEEAIGAFIDLSRRQGIIPALESAHAVAYATKLARTLPADQTVLVNLSGRGDKDLDHVVRLYGDRLGCTPA